MTRMEIPNRITEKYSKMTKSEKRIADYLMQKKWDLELMSITDLAEQCSVADSTIFRFCKKLGYGGYNDFKIALAKEQGRVQGQCADYRAEAYGPIYSCLGTNAGITDHRKCGRGSQDFYSGGAGLLLWPGRQPDYGNGGMGAFYYSIQTL